MNPVPSDPELLDLAYPYALDAMGEFERRAIERRRRRADRLTAAEFDAVVHIVRGTLATMSILTASPAPPELERRIIRALDDAVRTSCDPVLIAPVPETRRRVRFGTVVAAVAIVLALGGGAVAVHGRLADRPGPGDERVAAGPDTAPDIRVAEVRTGGRLAIRASASSRTAEVRFDGVPAPAAGQSYQIWLVAEGAPPRSVAVVPALPAGPVSVPYRATDVLALTVEPAAGSPQPTSEPIATLGPA
ncbi:anti-sigma factor [Nocardia sp. BMG111209]|uniref:anti-sigma factor n=1 Tax=Nocardia sp. BMG111209 TaxID=1160137 RepID=UPI000377223E|nr:anti-sigma factor [Nocardia sp. BMG111209]